MSDEITEPTVHLCWNDFAIRGAVDALRMAHLDAMADDMEAQLKPSVQEPEEFGSVVRAGISESSDRVLWTRGAGHYWFSETARRSDFATLHNPEVLRVGIGYDEESAYRYSPHPEDRENAYLHGRRDFAESMRRDISALRAATPLVVEQRAYDNALATIAALLGES